MTLVIDIHDIIISKEWKLKKCINSSFYLQGSQCFVYATPNAKVVNSSMLNDTLLVEDKEASKGNTLEKIMLSYYDP